MKKTAIITGASSGMGREALFQIADRFDGLEEIWAIARRKDRLEELCGQLPVHLRIFALDLSQPEAVEELSAALETCRPDVKILVNAAGFGKIGPVEDISTEEESGMIRVNCEAMCAVTHAVLPYISDNSRIIEFASAAAFVPQSDFAVYAATKAFVLSYSRALHYELRPRKIAVTAVCPGPVRTEFFEVAETRHKMVGYKRFFMANPKKVVRTAIRDSMMGKTVSVYGWVMKLFFLLCKVIPHDILLAVMADEKLTGSNE